VGPRGGGGDCSGSERAVAMVEQGKGNVDGGVSRVVRVPAELQLPGAVIVAAAWVAGPPVTSILEAAFL